MIRGSEGTSNRGRRTPGRLARALPAGVIAAAIGLALPASALSPATTIEAKGSGLSDNLFSPARVTRPIGTAFNWHSAAGNNEHTATRTGLIGWNFDMPEAAATTTPVKTLRFAGSYSYLCQIHGPEMHGTISIPVSVTPTSGSTTKSFTVTLATRTAPSGDTYELQLRKGAHGTWKLFKSTTAATAKFKAGGRGPGKYFFRSRVKRKTSSRATGYSPPRAITVN